MKTLSAKRPAKLLQTVLCCLVALLIFRPAPMRAGLNLTVDIYETDGYYVFYTPLNTNSLLPNADYGTYQIYSPGWPTNGSSREITYDGNGLNTDSGTEHYFNDIPSALDQITNGTWTMQFVSESGSTNTYSFTVSIPGGLSSNQLPATYITSPEVNAVGVINMPTFTWQGQPTNWPVTGIAYVYRYDANSSFYCPDPSPVSITQSNWTMPVPIPADGPSDQTQFNLDYVTNYTGTLFVVSTPVNTNNSQSLSAWTYSSTLESGGGIGFSVAPPPASSTNHVLIAHYAFDDSGFLGLDYSTNNDNLLCASGWGDDDVEQFTTDAEAGGGAVQFFGQSSLTPCGGTVFNSWTNTLFGSFTVSAWVKTTSVSGSDTDQLGDFDGQNIIYLNYNGNGLIPMGTTGTKAAFATGLPPGAYGEDTLHSATAVTTGDYVHVVVTRDQGSGQKQIYINGALDNADFGEPGILNGGANYASIGGQQYAPYTGELDDVQIYSGVLGSLEIASLYNSPGSTASNGASLTLGSAVGDAGDSWTTSGDTDWFIESTNTDNGDPFALESGVVTNYQSSTVTVTINGPVQLTFAWAAQGSINNFDYEVYLDGDANDGYLDDIYYDTDWYSDGPFQIPSGQHTVSWTAFAYGDDDPTEAGFLDNVTFSPIIVPLANAQISDGYFQFDFTGQYGFSYNVLCTTNLASGNWVTNQTVYGSGAPYRVMIPYDPNTEAEFFSVQSQ